MIVNLNQCFVKKRNIYSSTRVLTPLPKLQTPIPLSFGLKRFLTFKLKNSHNHIGFGRHTLEILFKYKYFKLQEKILVVMFLKNAFYFLFRASFFTLSAIRGSLGLSSVWRLTSFPLSSTSWPITSLTSSPYIYYHWSSLPLHILSSCTRFQKQHDETKVWLPVLPYLCMLC